jgi:hypothetical protein
LTTTASPTTSSRRGTTRNKVEAALNFKQDDHKGLTGEELGVHVNEDIWSFAAEYTAHPWKNLHLSGGAGVDAVAPNEFFGENNELMKKLGAPHIDKTEAWTLFAAEAGVVSWNKYRILHSELDVRTLTLYPEITANLYAVITPVAALSIIPSIQYSSSRYTDAKGENELAAYSLFNIKLNYKINERLSASSSIENIFDILYEIKQYAPMSGRTYNFTLTAKY